MHIQAEQSSDGDTNNEQCLITKTLDGATEMTRLKLRVWNAAEFRLSESSDKALSAKYANQAKPRDRERSKCIPFQEVGIRESIGLIGPEGQLNTCIKWC